MRKWTDEENKVWADAKASGQTRFEGLPCRTCGSTIRSTSGRHCVKCQSGAQTKRRTTNVAQYLLTGAKWRANAFGLDFDLTLEDIVIPKLCPVFGTPMERPSVDRHDNSKGYTKGNAKIISLEANRLKNNLTLEQAKALVKYMET